MYIYPHSPLDFNIKLKINKFRCIFIHRVEILAVFFFQYFGCMLWFLRRRRQFVDGDNLFNILRNILGVETELFCLCYIIIIFHNC